jgi:hypothetical protein
VVGGALVAIASRLRRIGHAPSGTLLSLSWSRQPPCWLGRAIYIGPDHIRGGVRIRHDDARRKPVSLRADADPSSVDQRAL